MKKLTSFLIVFLVALTLTSCTKQEVNKGLYFIISVPLLAGAIVSGFKALKSYNSGSTQQVPGARISSDKKAIPWGLLFFTAFLFLASIGSAKWIYEENRNYDPKRDKPYPEKPAPDGKESAEDQARKADSVYNLTK